MKTQELNGFEPLSNDELVNINGGEVPGGAGVVSLVSLIQALIMAIQALLAIPDVGIPLDQRNTSV